jgi:hypothetical protein
VDYDGRLHEESIESLKEAIVTGVNVIMVTGKVGSMLSLYCSSESQILNDPDLKWRLVLNKF